MVMSYSKWTTAMYIPKIISYSITNWLRLDYKLYLILHLSVNRESHFLPAQVLRNVKRKWVEESKWNMIPLVYIDFNMWVEWVSRMYDLFPIYSDYEPRLLFADDLKWKKQNSYSCTEGIIWYFHLFNDEIV